MTGQAHHTVSVLIPVPIGLKYDKVTLPNEKEAHHNDKANKNKGKNTNRHCNFCDCDGHIESK